MKTHSRLTIRSSDSDLIAAENAVDLWSVRVSGTVQGVGFRPTVYKLAKDHGIKGTVLNDGDGVLIEVWATKPTLIQFIDALKSSQPPLARIEHLHYERMEFDAKRLIPQDFTIVRSQSGAVATNISADAATCAQCLTDTMDPFSRRYRYPFTNCTHCGPRLSIIRSIPYDRANTSMSAFKMCADCQREYDDPENRRFHAQPNACYVCGPKAWLERSDGKAFCLDTFSQLDQVDAVCTLLQRGEIVAIKGIGGFHLACDATNADSVEKLRQRKKRFHKPLALMARDLKIIEKYCQIEEAERKMLQHVSAPIVLLTARSDRPASVPPIATQVASKHNTLGFMLPYTPLHHLLLKRMDRPIVLTSGNLSDEPQCIDNEDARERLSSIADYFLFHDREIVNRLDDSVVHVSSSDQPAFIRRARGFAPAPIALPTGFDEAPNLLAMGAELKSTFCLINSGKAIVSQHMGDLEDARTHSDYEKNLALYKECFQHSPARIAIDCHPEYLSSKLGRGQAQDHTLALDEIQHHHAHIASCMADNGWPLNGHKVMGVALDGLGYGSDGNLWGGEFLYCDYTEFERLGTFKPVALLGGAQAMREPWRNTFAHILAEMGWDRYKIEYDDLELTRFFEEHPLDSYRSMLKSNFNTPKASSCGRLFDAVAAALGICRESASYEGQAAIELEAIVDKTQLEDESLAYPFGIPRLAGSRLPYIEPIAVWHALLGDLIEGTPPATMSARFHLGLAKVTVAMVQKLQLRDDVQIFDTVALSGGCFQNRILLDLVCKRLGSLGYRVLKHKQVPANDGGISLGQAVISAALHIKERGN